MEHVILLKEWKMKQWPRAQAAISKNVERKIWKKERNEIKLRVGRGSIVKIQWMRERWDFVDICVYNTISCTVLHFYKPRHTKLRTAELLSSSLRKQTRDRLSIFPQCLILIYIDSNEKNSEISLQSNSVQ